jgi:DNA-binding CsgD family transcriptional regulator
MTPFQANTPVKATSRLTSRQIEVIKWIARGYLYKEIAGKLGISEKTVLSHTQQIGYLLGGFDKVGATHLAIRKGWVEVGDYRT